MIKTFITFNINDKCFNIFIIPNIKTKINIKNYYKQQYRIELKREDQPLLIEEIPKRRREQDQENAPTIRYLIPELVYLTGIDELDERDRAEIITKSKFQPNEKIKRIEKGFSYLKNTDKKKIKKKDAVIERHSPNEIRLEWGININNNFVELEAEKKKKEKEEKMKEEKKKKEEEAKKRKEEKEKKEKEAKEKKDLMK